MPQCTAEHRPVPGNEYSCIGLYWIQIFKILNQMWPDIRQHIGPVPEPDNVLMMCLKLRVNCSVLMSVISLNNLTSIVVAHCCALMSECQLVLTSCLHGSFIVILTSLLQVLCHIKVECLVVMSGASWNQNRMSVHSCCGTKKTGNKICQSTYHLIALSEIFKTCDDISSSPICQYFFARF